MRGMSEKILIISPSWIGDCVMAQPLFSALKAQNPLCVIDVFAPKWSMAVLERMPEVDHLLENPFLHGDIKLWQRFRLGRYLKKNGYRRAIVLPGSIKSALVPFFAGIDRRCGYLGESRHKLLNEVHYLDKKKLIRMVDRFVALAYPPDTPFDENQSNIPALQINLANQQDCLQRFHLEHNKPVVAFCPGAEFGPAKRWPARHFAKLATCFAQKGHQVWLFGSQKDHPIAEEIVHLSGGVAINLCGKTNLSDAIDLLALSNMVICNDSGLMHVAAALDRPIVALYGSSSPDHTPPLSNKAKMVNLHLQCSPCFERNCPLKHTDCLEKIMPQTVWENVETLWADNEIQLDAPDDVEDNLTK